MNSILRFYHSKCFFINKASYLCCFLLLLVTNIYAGKRGAVAVLHGGIIENVLPSSVVVSADFNPACFGSLITITATITPSDATGSIEFFDGATSVGIFPVSGGMATMSSSSFTAGSHALTAVYAGDINYATSTSPVLTQLIDAAIPANPGIITGSAGPICSGISASYSIATVANATNYNWILPAGWSITAGAGTNAITVTTGTSGGNVSVTAGNSCGNSAAQTKAVIITVTPAVPGTITGTTTTCPSVAGLVFSITAVPGATSYAWTFPAPGWTITAGGTTNSVTVTATASAASGNVLVAALNGACSSAASQTININPINASDNTGYTDGTTKFSDGITVATNTAPIRRGYLKFPLNSLSVIPIGSTITSVLKLTANTSALSGGNLVNALGSNDPVTTPATTLFAAATSGTNYSTAGWNASGVTTLPLASQANLDIASSISSPGYISMALIRAATGTSIANFWGYSAGANVPVLAVTFASLRSLAVTVSPGTPAAPGAITGPATVCPNSTGNIYSISPVTNATTYTWTVPAGWTITSGQGSTSIIATATLTGGNISVKAGNSCGTSAAGTPLAVSISALPTITATPTSQTKCSGVPINTITPSSPTGTSFTWTRDNTGSLTGMPASGSGSTITGTLNNITAAQQTTTFSIYALNALGCISTLPATVTVTIDPNPSANAGIDQAGCAATAVTIGGSPTASGGTPGYTYLWTPAAGLSNSTIANPTATPGTYTVMVTDSKSCTASAAVTISNSTGAKTWIGSGTGGSGPDNNFNNALNWSPAGVPGPCNDVTMNVDITSIFNFFGGSLTIPLNAAATIKSLLINVTGTVAFSSGINFKLDVGTNNLSILNNTVFNTNPSVFFSTSPRSFISVGPGGILIYGGNLTTSVSNNCLTSPIYANTNNTGKVYINGNASLAGILNDLGNKPSKLVFDGTLTQTITNNAGAQPIYLGATSTDIGESNSPTVVLAGAGTNGFRNIGDLNVNNTATLDIGSTQTMNRNAAGGTINLAAGSFLKIGKGSGGVGSSNFPSNFSAFNFNTTSTVDYNAAAGQTVFATPVYGNLSLSTSGNKTATGNITAQKNITIANSAIFAGGVNTITLGGNWTNYGQVGFSEQTSLVDFNGTGAQTINTTGGEVYYSLGKTAAGTTTMLSDVAVQGGGTSSFTLSAGTFDAGTFTFNSAASPLNISAGLLKLAKTGAALLPEFVITPYNITGGTIELYGAGDQVLRGSRAYRNLTFSTSGIKTVSSAITTITGTILTQNSVTLDVSINTMGGAGTNLSMTGTSLYKTAGTGTKPDAQGTYILGTGTTVEFTNSLATTEDIRLTAPTYYNVVVSGGNVANSSLGTGIKFQAGGTFTVKNGGLFKLGNGAGFSGGLATSVSTNNNPAIVLEDGSTIEYYGGPSGTNPQIITNLIPYYSLNFSGTSIKTAPVATITVKGNLSNNNSGFAHNNGTVLLNGITAQDYNSTGTALNYFNVTATNAVNVNIRGDLGIVNLLSLSTTGKINFFTGNISLRSGAFATASVDKISLPNSFTYTGAGRFIVERYIPTGIGHGKSWEFLSTPAFGQTVNATWQEGNAPLVVGTPGFGTTISSEKPGAVSRGYDFYTAPGPTIKSYNVATDSWVGIDDGVAITSSLQLANPKGYMIFVRGDRSVQTYNAAANPTIFRTSGKLYSPGTDVPPSSVVLPNKLESIGNPYASSIDFTSLAATSAGLDSKYYVWDPLLAGSLGYGGYQVFSSVTGWLPTPGGTTNYPSATPYTKIQSGQAFFVYSTPGGTVSFSENNKITGSQMVYRQSSIADRQYLKTYLSGNSGAVADGNVVAFDPLYNNGFDADDAIKIQNSSENFGIAENSSTLAISARLPVTSADTIFYTFNHLRVQPYNLTIVPEHIDAIGLTAFFVDKFNHTTTRISLSDSTVIHFEITNDAASYVPDRFYLVFRPAAPVPVTFVDISAKRLTDEAISVNWKVENEINIDHYELERSNDIHRFDKIGTIPPKLNNGDAYTYDYADEHPLKTDNFYRIKATSAGGSVQYSRIVKVAGSKTIAGITVYPNPVTERIMNIYFTDQPPGDYKLQLFNNVGQVVYTGAVSITGTNIRKEIQISEALGSGNYQIRIVAPGGKNFINNVVIK